MGAALPPDPLPIGAALASAVEARRRLAEVAPVPPVPTAGVAAWAAYDAAVTEWSARLTHEAIGALLIVGALGGPVWWWAARVVWHAARLHYWISRSPTRR